MKKLLLLLVAACFSLQVGAQTNLDSLWGVWHDPAANDTSRMLALKDLVEKGYLFSNPDTAFILCEEMILLAEEMNYDKWKATALNYQGISCAIRGRNDEAIRRFTQCLKVNEALGNNHRVASSLHNIGLIYEGIDEVDKALEYFQKSKFLFKEIDDKYGLAISYGSAAKMQNKLRLFPDAQKSAELGIEFAEEVENAQGIANARFELATALDGLSQEENDPTVKNGLLEKAVAEYKRCLDLKRIIGDREGEAATLLAISSFDKRNKTGNTFLGKAEQALMIAQEVGSVEMTRAAAEFLQDEYMAANEYRRAYEMQSLAVAMRDSINSEKNQREILRQEYKYTYEKEALSDSLSFAKKEAVMTERTEKQQIGLVAALAGFLLVLALAFAIYSGKKKSDELLLNILPSEVAEELKEKGHSDAQLIDHVTVLFTDFKGFTALSEQVTPKELVADLHECFSAFDKICEKFGIEKIKTIGDAYMAAGGLPSPNATHAKDVVRAALEMAQIVEQGKAKKTAEGLPYFEIRIGVHTGPVVAGIVGVKKFQYDIWGDTVNTASRMESSGEVGKVNISEATYELLKDDAQFSFESRGKIEAKGKGEMEMYFVASKNEF